MGRKKIKELKQRKFIDGKTAFNHKKKKRKATERWVLEAVNALFNPNIPEVNLQIDGKDIRCNRGR